VTGLHLKYTACSDCGGTSICQDCIVEADNILREYENTLHEMGMEEQWDEVPDCE
jgi:hypothetical protein